MSLYPHNVSSSPTRNTSSVPNIKPSPGSNNPLEATSVSLKDFKFPVFKLFMFACICLLKTLLFNSFPTIPDVLVKLKNTLQILFGLSLPNKYLRIFMYLRPGTLWNLSLIPLNPCLILNDIYML